MLLAATCQQKSPNPIFEVYDYEVASLIDLSAELEVLGYLSNAEKRIYFYLELMKKYAQSMSEIASRLE